MHRSYPIFAKYTEIINDKNPSCCAVCGDISSGKHYGILTCNGCSGFFKRTIRRKIIYHCQNFSNNCTIDKLHRNQCQACRFKKCLQMGMIKEAVQNQRSRRDQNQTISVLKQTKSKFVNHLDDTISSDILLMIIKWIRHLPTYVYLSIDDQLILIEESWAELFLLWLVEYSLSFDNHRLILHEKSIENIFEIFQKLKLDSFEYMCLKTIILFRCDLRLLKHVERIENLQDQAQMTLAQYTKIHHPTRFGRLLLTLPILRTIPSIFIEKTYFSGISISQLLMDMFKN